MLNAHDLFALGAAACWATGAMLSVEPSRHLGAFAFTRLRMLLVSIMLWSVVAYTGGWRTLPLESVGWVGLSGLVGIFVGDTAMFAAMNRLGPRRSGVLFATHAVFSALLGFWLLNERMSVQATIGAGLTVAGVMSAIVLGRRKEETDDWEVDRGHIGAGVVLGLLAAFCQALSSLLVKPVLQGAVDPVAASAVRVSVACAAQFVLLWSGFAASRPQAAPTLRVVGLTAINGFLAMGVGMTLVLLALKGGDLGMVAVLSSVTPVLVLPLLWLRVGRPPAPGAWLGAALTVLGTALVLLR